jgi:hypothetical protein
MANVNLYNAPAGVVGTVTRSQDSVVESSLLGEAFAAFGVPVKFDASTGKAMKIAASDAASVVKGILVRNAPSISGSTAEGFSDNVPNQESLQGILRFGFISVLCPVGTPVKGAAVYVRITADTGKFVGDIETAADSGKCVAIPGWEFAVSGKDANNITELYIK